MSSSVGMVFLLYFAGGLGAAYLALRAAARIGTEGISALIFFAFILLVVLFASLSFEAFESTSKSKGKRKP